MDYRLLVHEIIVFSVTHRYRVGKHAASLGLYFGQPTILEYISKNEFCTQKELAEHLHISPPSVATTLKRMEKSGFIERKSDDFDSRKKRLVVTEKGKKILTDFRKICDETDKELFRGFTYEELDTLFMYLKRLNMNLAEEDLRKSKNFLFNNNEKECN